MEGIRQNQDINSVALTGVILSKEKEYDIKNKDGTKDFYKAILEIPRLSGTTDKVPVILDNVDYENGDMISVKGYIKSRNYTDSNNRNHTAIFCYATESSGTDINDTEDNTVNLVGTICKMSPIRDTKSGRKIVDVILGVHRDNTHSKKIKSDYIPCVLWGNQAMSAQSFQVGDRLNIKGRFQSRVYHKDELEFTAYEVSTIEYSLQEGN